MRWTVWTDEGDSFPTWHDTSDEAVDELMKRVREHLVTVPVSDRDDDTWHSDATTILLKRYLDGAEGASHDMDLHPVTDLRIHAGGWTFYLEKEEV